MPDSVIVSVRYGQYEQDFSLPFQLPIHQWYHALLDALRFQLPSLTVPVPLYYEGKQLDPQYSLLQYHILDGAILTIQA